MRYVGAFLAVVGFWAAIWEDISGGWGLVILGVALLIAALAVNSAQLRRERTPS